VQQNWKRHLYLLLTLNTLSLVQSAGGRFAVVLFALHQQASPIVVGALIGLHSLVPALTSITIGRLLDNRERLHLPLAVACVFTTLGFLIPFVWESIFALFAFSVVTGGAFNVFRIGGQQITGRYGTNEDRPVNYSLYAQALAIGNMIAPLLAGFGVEHLGHNNTFLLLAGLLITMMGIGAIWYVAATALLLGAFYTRHEWRRRAVLR